MTSIKLTVTGAQIWASVTGVLTSGMVGIPVTIEYDEAWDGLTKNLMCRCSPWGSDDGEIRTRLNVGEASTVAHEVMQQGMYLYLGVEGFRADGTLVIPTTWARCGKIEYGANTCDDPSMDPELTIWNQLQTEMEETKKYVLTPEQAVNIQAYAQEARQAAEEAKQAAKHGLYYIPTISQPTDRTLRFAFTPSITGAPTPNPVTVVLPDEEDSGQNQNYTLPVATAETLGGVKAQAKTSAMTQPVGVDADGNLYVPPAGAPSDEQLAAYFEEHPVAAGATPEQVAQIAANTQSANVLNTVLQNSVLYEWPGLADERVPKYEGGSICRKIDTGSLGRRAVTGHRYLINNSIILRQGDMLITNADCAADAPNQWRPVLLKKGGAFTTAYNAGTPVTYGRAAFDGRYITYTATDPVEYIQISYKADVDYAVKVYVASSRTDEVTIPVTYAPGYLKATTGAPTSVGDGTTLYPSGYYTEQMTDLITVSAPGKFLLVKNVTLNSVAGGFRSEYPWCRYNEDGTLLYAHHKDRWDMSKNYYVIPLIADTEYIRFAFTAAANPLERLECLVVDREYLIRSGYGLHTYGKSMTAFGDSYIGEWSGSVAGVKILARNNLMEYTKLGHNGWGIAASPNYAGGLVENVEAELGSTDTDYYIIQAGRNDYNCQTPIGTNEDMHGPDVLYTQRSFKGALNWLCQWLVQNKPTKKVVFFTPWFFPSRTTSGDDEGNGTGSEFVETHKPVEYIDAIIEVAGMWGIPVLDCARMSGMHVRDEAFRTAYYRSADDVSHLNADGAALFAKNVQRMFEVL